MEPSRLTEVFLGQAWFLHPAGEEFKQDANISVNVVKLGKENGLSLK
jgi:hypothetical protein